MIPPFPMQLTLFGSALYGEFYLDLCRALAAPWLDPGWLVRASQSRAPSPSAAVRQDGAEGCARHGVVRLNAIITSAFGPSAISIRSAISGDRSLRSLTNADNACRVTPLRNQPHLQGESRLANFD